MEEVKNNLARRYARARARLRYAERVGDALRIRYVRSGYDQVNRWYLDAVKECQLWDEGKW